MCGGEKSLGAEMESENFTCRICGRPLDLKFSKTDENGKAVHSDCYANKLERNPPLQFPKKVLPSTETEDGED